MVKDKPVIGELKVGTIVKHQEKGTGVVVPNFGDFLKEFGLDLCGPDRVMVEFDGSSASVVCSIFELEVLDTIKVYFNPKICQKCIFGRNNRCQRYHENRSGWVMHSANGRIVPKRIYPYCQEEMSQK